jgi:hypothetical protein
VLETGCLAEFEIAEEPDGDVEAGDDDHTRVQHPVPTLKLHNFFRLDEDGVTSKSVP